jgi:NAD(P)-dependent dehydrogenase (short-subunit alcohol dehydrogenase family)
MLILNKDAEIVGMMQLQDAVTGDGYDAMMQTNHLSHFLLTTLLMPALEVAAATHGSARVVNHSSTSRKFPPTPLQPKYLQKGSKFGGSGILAAKERYHQGKLANMLFTSALQVYQSCSLRAPQTSILFPKLDQQQVRQKGKSYRHDARQGKRLGRVETPGGDKKAHQLLSHVAPSAGQTASLQVQRVCFRLHPWLVCDQLPVYRREQRQHLDPQCCPQRLHEHVCPVC